MMSPQVPIRQFDYESLDLETAQFMQQQTGEIRGLMRRTAQDIFEIGVKLIQVKEKIGHGRFKTWLSSEFDWTERTAQQFMNVARRFKSENFSDLQLAPSALYVLAASSTPEKARQEAINRAKSGEAITHKTAKAIKEKYITDSYPLPQQDADSPPRKSEPEIIAVCPVILGPSLPTSLTLQTPSSPPQTWWHLGKTHHLYGGMPNSPQFLERLPAKISLSLAFPPIPQWSLKFPSPPDSELILFSRYQDVDPSLFLEMIRLSLLLYSESTDVIVISYLPNPMLLRLVHQLGCYCFIAEPDPQRRKQAIATWQTLESSPNA